MQRCTRTSEAFLERVLVNLSVEHTLATSTSSSGTTTTKHAHVTRRARHATAVAATASGDSGGGNTGSERLITRTSMARALPLRRAASSAVSTKSHGLKCTSLSSLGFTNVWLNATLATSPCTPIRITAVRHDTVPPTLGARRHTHRGH